MSRVRDWLSCGLLLVGLLVVMVPESGRASEWVQERPYVDVAVSPSGGLRYGLYVEDRAAHVDVMDGLGRVLRTVDIPVSSEDPAIPHLVGNHRIDLWDDILVVSLNQIDALDDSVYWTWVLRDERPIAAHRWSQFVTVYDVAVNSQSVFVALRAEEPPQVTVLDIENLEDCGIQTHPGIPCPDGNGLSRTVIPIQDDGDHLPVSSITADDDHFVVYRGNGLHAETFTVDGQHLSSVPVGVSYASIDGHPGVDGTNVAMPVSPPEGETCGVSIHSTTGGQIDCFLQGPGGAVDPDDQRRYGGFDVDACGGIVVVDYLAEDDGLVGHKLIASNRDDGCFVDSLDSIFANDIAELGRSGVTKGCNPPDNDRFCPTETVTRETMAAFMVRALDLTDADHPGFIDVPAGSLFETDIKKLANAGITRGCNPPDNDRFCPTNAVTRGEIAAFFARALQLDAASIDYFTDDDNSIFEDDINRLTAAGITRGCNPPDNDRFCPTGDVIRGEIAAFFARVPGLLDS